MSITAWFSWQRLHRCNAHTVRSAYGQSSGPSRLSNTKILRWGLSRRLAGICKEVFRRRKLRWINLLQCFQVWSAVIRFRYWSYTSPRSNHRFQRKQIRFSG